MIKPQNDSVEDLWSHCERFDWRTESMFAHIYRLADMLPSTKECVEDIFGAGVDLQRSNKNPWKVGTVEKLHFVQSHWVRLNRDEWPKLRPQTSDFAETRNHVHRKHVNIGSFAPQSTASSIFRLASLKKRTTGEGSQTNCFCFLL